MIVPGFLIGLSCLLLVTYRTILAFFSDGKAIIININKYGEQFLDIAALIIIWMVFLMSLYFLVRVLRREKTSELNFFRNDSKAQKASFIGYFSKYKKE